jgi:diacylglycerol kinase family enzyme
MKHSFNRCVIITNSVSTNHHRARRLSNDIKKHFADGQIDVIEITPGKAITGDNLVEDIIKNLDGKTLVCIGGGDGSISMFINRLLLTKGIPKSVRRAVILPLWGGNANDLAYMVNGSAFTADIKRILKKGRVVKVYPMEVTIKTAKTVKHLANNYASFGASAYATKQIGGISDPNPVRRFFKEVAAIAKATKQAKPFTAEIDGRQATIYDLILINGSRIAKVYRAPNRLTDRAFFELIIDRKPQLFLSYMARAIRGLARKRNRRDSHSLTVHDATWAQLDGEVVGIPKGARIEIKTYTAPFYVLSTKLRAK